MPAAIKGFLLAATLFGLIGITLTYDAIARLKRHQVPPFHPEGFYTVMYVFPKPPEPIILFYNSLLGRILVVSSALVVPAFFSYLQINRERPVSAFFCRGESGLNSASSQDTIRLPASGEFGYRGAES